MLVSGGRASRQPPKKKQTNEHKAMFEAYCPPEEEQNIMRKSVVGKVGYYEIVRVLL